MRKDFESRKLPLYRVIEILKPEPVGVTLQNISVKVAAREPHKRQDRKKLDIFNNLVSKKNDFFRASEILAELLNEEVSLTNQILVSDLTENSVCIKKFSLQNLLNVEMKFEQKKTGGANCDFEEEFSGTC